MKPLWRWTVGGNIGPLGWEVFSESVRLAPKVYPEFDFVICCNNVNVDQKAYLESHDFPVVLQTEKHSCVPYRAKGEGCEDFAWKLMPPRLRIEAHELWVDNDIVIRDKIPAIDQWLGCYTGIVSRGFDSLYGRFQEKVDPSVDCCAGFFGLPPYFDFRAHIIEICGDEPLMGFDEQGLVVYVVSNLPGRIIVPYANLRMWGHWQTEFHSDFPEGIHFVGANRNERLLSWEYYKQVSTP